MSHQNSQVVPNPLPCNGDPTIQEAAAENGVHTNTVRRWIRQGRITAYRVGPRRIRIDRASLTAVITPIAPRPESL